MRYLLVAVVATLLTGLCLVFYDRAEMADAGPVDYDCGRGPDVTIETGKPIKTIFLVENLVKAHPNLSCRMWDVYPRVAQFALEKFNATNPSYQPVIQFYNTQADTLDPLGSAKIISEAAKSDALAVVGFAWSTMASMAAVQAEKEKIPYVSPTAVVRRVFEGAYSVSLGTPAWEAAKAFRNLAEKLEHPKVIIVEATHQIQEREYAEALRMAYPDNLSIQYQDDFPAGRVIAELDQLQSENHLVFILGYTDVKAGIHQILSLYPRTRIVVGPQWSHDHKLLDFEGEIYCISDYSNFVENSLHDEISNRWAAEGHEVDGGYLFALFDALMFTLKAMDDPNVKSREDVIARLKNFGAYDGAKGSLKVNDGTVSKPVYLLRYKRGNGFDFIEKAQHH